MLIDSNGVTLQVETTGTGAPVVLLPFLGRSIDDYGPLVHALVDAGLSAVGINPRGIGESRGELTGLTLHDYAADVAGVIERLGSAPVVVVGYTFGNRVARCLAADRPELVRGVVLLAAGGTEQEDADAHKRRRSLLRQLAQVGSGYRPRHVLHGLAKHLLLKRVLKKNYFAPGAKVPESWLYGWWPDAIVSQIDSTLLAENDPWWRAGSAPILVIQGANDQIAPTSKGHALREALGQRVQVQDLAGAGHALLAEQPAQIGKAVIDFVRSLPDQAAPATLSGTTGDSTTERTTP